MKDKLGNEIEVGDTIVYGASLGRCAALSVAIVQEVRVPEDDKWSRKSRLKVKIVNSQYDDDRFGGTRGKSVSLYFPDRTIVLEKGDSK